MTTLEEIVAAAKRLKPSQFVQLRKQLDRLEERVWKVERSVAAGKLRAAGVSDDQIDKMVIRRRRESRS